ncbi:type I-E CRISPR-associated protein Cse2/CasB [uncultured Pseudacidovorax sp.]|uniref:type I-E CRISPR-associated protein Cse2/CasB n=1 Tax=uncultured Pseudacidovorax sp. TaxID=679313 RepID=UPI0025F1B59D|nr:type I-E CRISPR-associated protein Cse2/CasB [uncultured Pseudacidovorax sp.]
MAELIDESATTAAIDPPPPRANAYGALAAHVRKAGPGDRAALARLDPDALRPHEIAALSRALLAAGLQPDSWRPETWSRWALVAHGMALAGHDGSSPFGKQLAQAGVAESRVTRLLTARGEAFRQLLPRLLRLLASKDVPPNWFELGELVRWASPDSQSDNGPIDPLCLRIAGHYFSAIATQSASKA